MGKPDRTFKSKEGVLLVRGDKEKYNNLEWRSQDKRFRIENQDHTNNKAMNWVRPPADRLDKK